jgi:hypothetical protein
MMNATKAAAIKLRKREVSDTAYPLYDNKLTEGPDDPVETVSEWYGGKHHRRTI